MLKSMPTFIFLKYQAALLYVNYINQTAFTGWRSETIQLRAISGSFAINFTSGREAYAHFLCVRSFSVCTFEKLS